MLRFAESNITEWIVELNAAEHNSFLALVHAPHPFDPVAYANLRKRGHNIGVARGPIPTYNPFLSNPASSLLIPARRMWVRSPGKHQARPLLVQQPRR